MTSINGYQIRIKGTVQGVGFRPFIWQLAKDYSYVGEVYNDQYGVIVNLYNANADNLVDIDSFVNSIHRQLPNIACITALSFADIDTKTLPKSFTISKSQQGAMETEISPDINTCDACRTELLDKNNRRFHYPFINCTHCGPRFSIIQAMPYDRQFTSMAAFPLCQQCQQEFDDPANRRFHAQPTACADCGPQVWLSTSEGKRVSCQEPIAELAKLLTAGAIVAIKGVGGFHLACDATNASSVQLLRERKHRPDKPFALLTSLPQAQQLAEISSQESQLLKSVHGPLVILNKKIEVTTTSASGAKLANNVAPEQSTLAIMLPSNPVQILLMEKLDIPLVMTSGNVAGDPPCIDNDQALTSLSTVADYFLLHDRSIVNRVDDSIVRWLDFSPIIGNKNNIAGQLQTLRRARGFVPQAMALPEIFANSENILALGADIKNTFCLIKAGQAQVSQHLGDIANLNVFTEYQQQLQRYQKLFALTPCTIISDLHPGYQSQKINEQQVNKITVQHHHAHAVAVIAEHQLSIADMPALALTLDGLGFAPDSQTGNTVDKKQAFWGGELLLVDYHRFEHLWGLPAIALPGGDIAAKQPWRNLMAHLHYYQQDSVSDIHCDELFDSRQQQLWQVIDKQFNCPLASSAGRLFDAVAAYLAIVPQQLSYEGQAAIVLENYASQALATQPHYLDKLEFKVQRFDHQALWSALLLVDRNNASKQVKQQAALDFHLMLAQMLIGEVADALTKVSCKYLVLSGGVCQNKLLLSLLHHGVATLARNSNVSIELLLPHKLPANDGGLSFGQAVIGCALNH